MADDLTRLAHDLGQGVDRALDRLETAAAKSGADVTATAQQYAPVDTGFLRGSISADPPVRTDSSVSVDIGPTANYGHYVEYGTHRMSPRAYMGPGLVRNEDAWVQAVAQAGAEML